VTCPDHLRLAVVDDDDDVRRALGRLLRSLGHDVRAFASAEEFEANPAVVDCLILDVRLPGLSGLELRDRIRLGGSAIPIVFITGDSEPFTREGARQINAPSLAKPFDDDQLVAAINRAVSAAGDTR
jgi:FixJ family two-component response regulator